MFYHFFYYHVIVTSISIIYWRRFIPGTCVCVCVCVSAPGPAESLRHVFTWLGFQVEVVRDATRDQMLSSMRELASRDHSGMDCVACVVLIAWS